MTHPNARTPNTRSKRNQKKKTGAFTWLLLLSLFLVVPLLFWRVALERSNHSSLILFDLLELQSLEGSKAQNKFAALMVSGVSGFFAPECTGEEIGKGVIEKVAVFPLSTLPSDLTSRFSTAEGTVVELKNANIAPLQLEYLSHRFSGGEILTDGEISYYRIPVSYGRLEESGIMPDLQSMRYLSLAGVPMVYAPAPSFGSTADELIDSLNFICERFPSVKALCPTGEIAAIYPNTKLLGDFVREHDLLMAQVEFSRQYGSAGQTAAAWPNIVSLHGVDRAEVLKRNITRTAMLNRFFRAAKEREVRLLVLRLDPLRSVAMSLDEYCADVKKLRTRLDEDKFSRLWPKAAPSEPKALSFPATLALHLFCLTLIAKFIERFSGVEFLKEKKPLIVLIAAAVLLAVVSPFVRVVPKLAGALTVGLLAAEASLTAMDYWKVPIRGVVQAFLLTLGGGLIVAGSFSTPLYIYRMTTFSGVKVGLLLPLLLVFFMDLRKREHPESLTEILSRPPIWGELALAGVLCLAALVMLLRSGNYGFVSNSEIAFRDWLEDILGARPRTKEFLIGYPSIVLWYWLKRHDLLAHWREVLRMAVTLAYSSAVNSFCHFHTPLSMTILRTFNGWWIGLLLGVLALTALCVLLAFYRKLTIKAEPGPEPEQ